MKKLSALGVATVVAIAFYFAVRWGYQATLALVSPTYGLDDALRSQAVFALGRMVHLGPVGLIQLAAAVAALKAVVAGTCLIHIFARAFGMFGVRVDHDFLESALMLVVVVTGAILVPGVLYHNPDVVRGVLVDLALAGIAIALCARDHADATVLKARIADTHLAKARIGKAAGAAKALPAEADDAADEALALAGLSQAAAQVPARKWYSPWR